MIRNGRSVNIAYRIETEDQNVVASSSSEAYRTQVRLTERAQYLGDSTFPTDAPCLLSLGGESIAHNWHAQPPHPPAFRFLPLLWRTQTSSERLLRLARNSARGTRTVRHMCILGPPLHSRSCGARRARWKKTRRAVRAARCEG